MLKLILSLPRIALVTDFPDNLGTLILAGAPGCFVPEDVLPAPVICQELEYSPVQTGPFFCNLVTVSCAAFKGPVYATLAAQRSSSLRNIGNPFLGFAIYCGLAITV